MLIGCTRSRLEYALDFAGDNRSELEKVLNYYNTDQKDSLKYKAAVFLIENMPYYYALQNDKIDQYREELYNVVTTNHCTGEYAIEILESKYGKLNPNEYEKVYDAQVITSLYLINNIEQSFKVWKEREWNKQIGFEDFCEQILPYRISTEPLENWREAYYNTYQPILDSLLVDKKDAVAAFDALYDSIVNVMWAHFENIPLPYMGAINLLKSRIGNCTNRTELSTYIMRSLGIPGGTDFRLQYPNRAAGGHSWNFVTDTLGKAVPYSLNEERPGQVPDIALKKGRVYRKFFAVQPNSLPLLLKNKEDIPNRFNTAFIRDVSSEYFSPCEIKIEVAPHSQHGDIMYLATFNNQGWRPVAWTKIDKKQARFQYVDQGIIYLPAYYQEGKIIPTSYPVLMKEDGTYEFLKPNLQVKQSLTLHRKYPIQPWWRQLTNRPVGGRFQGANNPQFRNAVTFHTITDTLDMKWHKIDVNDSRKFRYVRYLSAKWGLCNIAELRFFSENDSLLTGTIIGTEGSFYNEVKNTKIAVFDGDPLTFYDAKEYDDSWAGLDLGKAQSIKKIDYLFRNDDNGIRIGDKYELFYWNENQWNSLGKKEAEQNVLQYENCPKDALFLLRNHSRGKEEQVFTYEDGKQVWW